MIAFILLACTATEKGEFDTADFEDTAQTEITEDTGNTEFTEPTGNTDFPDLQQDYNSVYETALPAPILDMGIGNITAYAGFLMSMGPIIELQIMVASVGQENITCPAIDGVFPSEGAPLEDVTVTGNGCVNDEGKRYDGSLVYNEAGVSYNSYTVTTPLGDENCPDAFITSITDGGSLIDDETGDIPFIVKLQNEELDEDCNPVPSTVFLNGDVNIDESNSEETLVNGDLTFLLSFEEGSMWFMAITEDEVLNRRVCESEPISGTNTMTNGEDDMVYTFDGVTDCDEEPTQLLSINGGESVEVQGASCSANSSRGGILGMFFAFGLMLLRRKGDATPSGALQTL